MKIRKKISLLVAALSMLSNIAFAEFSADDAQTAVERMYESANDNIMIMSVEEYEGDTGLVWEIVFHSRKYAPSTVCFDADTGEVLSRDIQYH